PFFDVLITSTQQRSSHFSSLFFFSGAGKFSPSAHPKPDEKFSFISFNLSTMKYSVDFMRSGLVTLLTLLQIPFASW
ncbi:MAG: hypothetical protein MI923_06675, partial [Phycisphaerales bacterium]|nr:hypothetical protein [Phycisphaerales bacterium]